MNKLLILAFTLIVASTNAFAQKSRSTTNQEYGQKYKEIGTDPSLSGYEKGKKKKELALKQKQENTNYNNNNHSNHQNSDSRDKKKKEYR